MILVTRSIRRLPDAFNLEMCGDIESGPWDHDFTALGRKLLTTKRYQTAPDEAAEDPPTDVEGSKLSHGDVLSDGSTLPGAPKMEPVVPAVVEQQEQPKAKEGVSAKAGMKPPPPNAAVGGDVEMDRATSSAPLVIIRRDDLELEASPRPSKKARFDDADKTMAVHEQHEDEIVFTFDEAEYDEGLDEPEAEPADESSGTHGLLEILMFPFDIREPEVSAEELVRLDAIADGIEIERLKCMKVLEDLQSSHDTSNMKTLSTRFVRTWRDKTFGSRRVWLRRSRLVAREFAWLSERNDLFSQASNALAGRLLQTMCLRNLDKGHDLGAIDIADAFLTVKQREATLVSLTNATGEKCSFNLGKVLPGQRAGSQWWYEDITHVLCNELEMVQCEPYPNLLANKDRSYFILLHVDDMLVTGDKQFVTNKLLGILKKHYKVSSNFIQEIGDEITFLKRSHRLLGGGKLVI